MSRRTRWIVAISLLVIAAIYAWIGNPLDPFDDFRFSRERWQSASAGYDLDTRARMTRDITRRIIRSGMSEKEVVDLLGRPETIVDRRARGDSPLPAGQIYRYHLGSWTFQRMDDAFLYVHLDAGGRALASEIYGY